MPGMAETAKLISSLELKDKFSGPAKKASGSLTQLDKGFGRVGKGAGQIGAGLTRSGALLGTALAGGLVLSAKAAIDWEDAFTGVRKTVDATPEQLDAIGTELRKLSTQMPNSAEELAGIAEAGGQMGIAAGEIVDFTKQVAILASTTNVSAEDAAMALGQLQNVIGLTGDEFDNFAASLVDLGNAGSSTESAILEIARRSGGAAKLFGIAKEQTLGWAAAAANLGLNQELAGTALQNIFVKLMPKIQGNVKALRDVFGKSGTEIQKMFKKDAGGALQEFFKRLGQVEDKAQRLKLAQALFGSGSGITRTVLGLAESYDENLAPSLDKASQSWKDATAAQAEFDKRNATVRSSLSRLQNTVKDAAITIGEGMAPAIGRAADRLAKFLQGDDNRQFLKTIGEDVGKAIDSINWDEAIRGGKEFVGYLKIAFDYAQRILTALNALPTEVKAAAGGFLVLNKLSGGLLGAGLGNVVGGIGETIVKSLGSMIPGVGRAFVQPVFVTNFPVGLGVGGAGGVGGALGALSKVFLVGEAIGLAVAVEGVRQEIGNDSTRQATAIQDQTTQFLASQPSKAALENSLAGVNKGISDMLSNPLTVLVQGEALEKLRQMQQAIKTQLADQTTTKDVETKKGNVFGPQGLGGPVQGQKQIEKVQTAVETMKGKMADDFATAKRTAEETTTAVEATKARVASQVQTSGSLTASATRTAGSGIEAAIRNNRPMIDIDIDVSGAGLKSTVDVNDRYGPAGGDRNWQDVGRGNRT